MHAHSINKVKFCKKANICFEVLQNKSAPGLNRGLSSNFLWLRSADHVKFTEKCVICTVKQVLVKNKKKNLFTNELNIGLLLWA